MTISCRPAETQLSLGTLHFGQAAAYWALKSSRFKALRCGRRFGKTDFAKIWVSQALAQGWECAWFAPQHMTWAEVYSELAEILRPILDTSSKGSAVMRMKTGGRLDFWTMENVIAGRGRRYRQVVIDEAAFAKDGDNKVDGSAMEIWEKSIKPTLYDYGGEALVCSNSAGKNPDNFFYNICTDPQYGFKEYHATTMDNPTLPKLLVGETLEAWEERRQKFIDDLIKQNEKLLDQGQPVPYPKHCDGVFAVIDTASKTGTENDATAVTFFARDRLGGFPLLILDWDIRQIEGAMLEIWLPGVFERLEELARQCGARYGALGAWIEDKNSGTILLQQAARRNWTAHSIESKLTALGKDERAISVSGYVYRGNLKYTDYAFNKTNVYKRKSRNHLVEQVETFRIGDKDKKLENDLLDTFCYGIAIGLGNSEGF